MTTAKFVKLVRVSSVDDSVVEIRDIRNDAVYSRVLREPSNLNERPAARDHLERAASLSRQMGYEPVFPEIYQMTGYTTPLEASAVDLMLGYCSVEMVETLPDDNAGTGGGKFIVSIEEALAAKTATVGSVSERGGRKTKSQMAREIIAANYKSKTPEEMVAMIAEQCGFKLPLARVYFRDSVKKVVAMEPAVNS